jgi:hypothetical protein
MENENTEVQRLSEEGICAPDAIAAVTDTYLKDRSDASKLTQGPHTVLPFYCMCFIEIDTRMCVRAQIVFC